MKKKLLMVIGLFLLLANVAMAQSAVRGRVLDDKGDGISGASVRVKSSNRGTNTDNNGGFAITAKEDDVLIISAIGFKSMETKAEDGVSVKLNVEKRGLGEVVVTALGVKREKAAVGYATANLTGEEINKGNNTSALGALQGKVSGVNITSNTGGPGGSTRVVLRGEKSLSRGNNALIVVDGIPVNNGDRTASNTLAQIDFGNRGNDINPDDIESITVLKGAAATALYGSDGAAGAVMITTKSGKKRAKGRPAEISYSISNTWHNVLKYPKFQNEYGQGDLQGVEDDRRENFSWGLKFDDKLRPWGQIIDGKQKIKPYSAIKNNVQSFFNVGKTLENNISFTGGGDKTTFVVSLNALNHTGIVENNFMNRYGVRFNASHDFSNKFYSAINVNYINSTARTDQQGQGDGGLWNNLIQTPRDIPVSELSDLNDAFNSYTIKDLSGNTKYGYYGAYTNNPYYIARNFDNRNKYDRVIGSVTTGYRISPDIELMNRFGGEMTSDRTFYKTPKYNLTPIDPLYDGNNKASNGGYFEGADNLQTMYNDLMLTVKKNLTSKIGFNGLLGHSVQQIRSNSLGADIDPVTNGLVIDNFYNLSNATSPVTASNVQGLRRKIGVYTSLDFDYNKTFFVTLTGRNDWSSTLANTSYFYPSVSGSWLFTKSIGEALGNTLNFGKLRASWAQVGTDAIQYQNNSAGFGKTEIDGGFGTTVLPFNGVSGFTLGNGYGGPSLQPERSNQSEIGVDLGLFKDRVRFDFTLYQNLTSKQIISQPISPSSGFTGRTVNTGVIENKGIEIGINATPVKLRNGFKWDVYGTFTRNRNEVVSLGDDTSQQIVFGGFGGMSIVAKPGLPFGTFYAVDLLKDSLGRQVIDANTGNPKSTPNPVYLGSYQPKFIASWGTALTFKGINLSVLFDTKQGGMFYSRTKDNLEFVGTSSSSYLQGTRDEVLWENSSILGANGSYVANTTFKTLPYYYFTSANVKPVGQDLVDASYVKLRELSISYSIPAKIMEKTKLGNASLGFFGNNLAIWTHKSNTFVDPEVNSGGSSNVQGFDYLSRPSLRNYGVRLNVTF